MPSNPGSSARRSILLTGFEPYGGRGVNPAEAVARSLDKKEIGNAVVETAILPVAMTELQRTLGDLIERTDPILLIGLGLYPGEPTIRLERFAVNLADFELPDNAGARLRDIPLNHNGHAALRASLPLRDIERSLLASGLPARISNSAGTFLCNAMLYHALSLALDRGRPSHCGFVHLPYLPEQVADFLIDAAGSPQGRETMPAGPPPSMSLATMTRAVETVLRVSLQSL